MACRLIVVMLMIACVWQALELMFYGEIQPRAVDDIMCGMWCISLVGAYSYGFRLGKNATEHTP
ncbi:MAG: hypothetical protein VB049_04925 [Candidatus Pelethousia sp.]|nr:hypothetical protein [Candidatus Pelethousia sp.]